MKKTLSLLLVLAMVLSSFSFAFAAEAEKTPGEILKDLGVLTGNAKGDLMLEDELSRQDMVVLLSRVLGQEDEAKAFKGEMSFTDVNDSFYKPYIAWAEANELTNGVGEGKFGFGRAVTEQEVATLMLRALGYNDVEFKDVPAKAAELGLVEKGADLTVNAKRARMAEITLAALGTKMNGSEKTLAEKLGIELPVPEVLEVKEVVADNLKEIKVVFNKDVDVESALDFNNYDTDAGDIEDIVYLADENMAIITLKEAMTNKEEYELTIDGVKDEKTVLDVAKEFKAVDNAIPEVVEVVGLGTKAVKVVMSEPVQTAGSTNFALDGKTIYGSFKPAGRDIIIKTYSDMTVGEHELTVKNLKDFAEFKSLESKNSFEVVEDKDAPTVAEVKAPALERVVVTFSEDVDDATVSTKTIYWKNGGTKVYPSNYVRLAGNKYAFTFAADSALPVHETTIYVEGVKDYSGNKMATAEVAVKASIDETRPEVKKVEVKDSGKTVVVTFSKAVNKDVATDIKNYKVLDSDDNKVLINKISAADNSLRVFNITLGKALDAAETYTLKISGIYDNTKYKNYMADYSEKISVSDYDAPTLKTVVCGNPETKSGKNIYTLTLYFDRDMDISTVSNPANYLVELSTGNKVLSNLDNDINVIKSDGSVVVITITVKDTIEVRNLAGLGVKGSNGKELTNYGQMVGFTNATAPIALEKYQATAKDTIKLTFSADIKDAPKETFTVKADGVTKDVKDIDINGDVVTLTFEDKALHAGQKNVITIDKVGDKAVTAYDGRIYQGTKTLEDKIAPTMTDAKAEKDGTTITITLTFDEEMGNVNKDAIIDARELIVAATANGEEVDYNIENVKASDGKNTEKLLVKIDATQKALKDVAETEFFVDINPKNFIKDAAGNAANAKEMRTNNVVGIKDAVAAKAEVDTEIAKVGNTELAKGSTVDANTVATKFGIDTDKVTVTVEAVDGADNQYKVTLTHKTVTDVKADKTVTITVAAE